ncbi:MAG: FeoA domain-containing protein [Deltaproteobacteria bacterium]|nr:FeoA domain-containing protein [Deltaproteobacteria bacterium]
MYQPDKYNQWLFNFINRVHEIEEKAFENELLAKDLTYTEIHVVYELGKYEAPQPMNVIAQDLQITQSSLTSLVNRIEEKKYLKRTRDESDRRIVSLELTERGNKLNYWHTQFHKNLTKKIREILNPGEVDLFFNTLQKLNHSMSIPLTADQLKPGQVARIESIRSDGSTKTRLMEMGVLSGTKIKLLKIAPLGDPFEIQVRGSLVSIRKQEASQIEVSLSEEVYV